MKVLNCDDRWNQPMLPRELDEYIAENLLNWKPAKIPADIDGLHPGEVLTPNGLAMDYTAFSLPPKGRIARMYFVPEYSRQMQHATTLAIQCGYTHIQFDAFEITHRIPEQICRAVVQSWIHSREVQEKVGA